MSRSQKKDPSIKDILPKDMLDYVASHISDRRTRRNFFTALGKDAIAQRRLEAFAIIIDVDDLFAKALQGDIPVVKDSDIQRLSEVNQELETIVQDKSHDDAINHKARQLQALIHARPGWKDCDPKIGYELAIELCREKDTPENREIFCICAHEFFRKSPETLEAQQAFAQREILKDRRALDLDHKKLLKKTLSHSTTAIRCRDLIVTFCVLKWQEHSPDDDIARFIGDNSPQNEKHAIEAAQTTLFLLKILGPPARVSHGDYFRRVLEKTSLPLSAWKFVLDKAEQAVLLLQSQEDIARKAGSSLSDLQVKLEVLQDTKTYLVSLAQARDEELEADAVEAVVRQIKETYRAPWLNEKPSPRPMNS